MANEILYSIGETPLKDLIKAKNADKDSSYYCPDCKQPFILRKGLKKRPHFAHKSVSPNCTPESALHYSFKTLLHNKIQYHLDQNLPLNIHWKCNICNDVHKGNLLKKATMVRLEHDLGVCRPDIALLDKNGKAIAVIEVVVTHKPSQSAIEYYRNNKVIPILYILKADQDVDRLNYESLRPDSIDLCTNPKCSKCGHYMQKKQLIIVDSSCWKCHSQMKVALVIADIQIDLDILSSEDIQTANEHGCFFNKQYSQFINNTYLANTCRNCNNFIGENFLPDYLLFPTLKREVIDIGFFCLYCVNKIKTQKS
ncbi:hypothetical protein H6F42_16355 [Pseudanabaena sp. FACHB-1998]|uniref:competence protein CoiA family protein n=1 Tax=Pseudanabaena sp. FACHB-1998 TaxID=2692858 RepID=UPI001680E899|nr:competence protein CoiA family protein [Pseudanabaena sp. FACHB-1998]MBD2178490.1 hypothetical protein [Pseudanabaena sp. FACHB-1998]